MSNVPRWLNIQNLLLKFFLASVVAKAIMHNLVHTYAFEKLQCPLYTYYFINVWISARVGITFRAPRLVVIMEAAAFAVRSISVRELSV